jgi:hypothetical protein
VKRRLRRFSATAVLPQKSWAVPKKAGQRQAILEGVLESYLNPPRIESTKGNSLTRRRLSAVVAKIVLEIVVIKVCEIEDVVSIHHKPKLLVPDFEIFLQSEVNVSICPFPERAEPLSFRLL